MNSTDTSHGKAGKHFDPRFCRVVVVLGAFACALLVLSEIVLVATLDPLQSRCPGRMLVAENGSATPIWWIVAMPAVSTLVVVYYAVTWEHFARKIVGEISQAQRTWVSDTAFSPLGGLADWREFKAFCARSLNFNKLLVAVVVGFVAFAAIPLGLLFVHCK